MWIKLQSTLLNTNNVAFIGVQTSPNDSNKMAVIVYATNNVRFVIAEGDKEHCYDVLDKLTNAINEEEGVWPL